MIYPSWYWDLIDHLFYNNFIFKLHNASRLYNMEDTKISTTNKPPKCLSIKRNNHVGIIVTASMVKIDNAFGLCLLIFIIFPWKKVVYQTVVQQVSFFCIGCSFCIILDTNKNVRCCNVPTTKNIIWEGGQSFSDCLSLMSHYYSVWCWHVIGSEYLKIAVTINAVN